MNKLIMNKLIMKGKLNNMFYLYYEFIDKINDILALLPSRKIELVSGINKEFFILITRVKKADILKSRIIVSTDISDRRIWLMPDNMIDRVSMKCLNGEFYVSIEYLCHDHSTVKVYFQEKETIDFLSFIHNCIVKDFSRYNGIGNFKNINTFFSYVRTYIKNLNYRDILLDQYMKGFNVITDFMAKRLREYNVQRFVLDYEVITSREMYDSEVVEMKKYIRPIITNYTVGLDIHNSLVFLQSSKQVIYIDQILRNSETHIQKICYFYIKKYIDDFVDRDLNRDYEYKLVFDMTLLKRNIAKYLLDESLNKDITGLYMNYNHDIKFLYTPIGCGNVVLGLKENNTIQDFKVNQYQTTGLNSILENWNYFLKYTLPDIFNMLSIKYFRIVKVENNTLYMLNQNLADIVLKLDNHLLQSNQHENTAYLQFNYNGDGHKVYLKNANLEKLSFQGFSYQNTDFFYYLLNNKVTKKNNDVFKIFSLFAYYDKKIDFLSFTLHCLEKDNNQLINEKIWLNHYYLIKLIRGCPKNNFKTLLNYYIGKDHFLYLYTKTLVKIENALLNQGLSNFFISKIDKEAGVIIFQSEIHTFYLVIDQIIDKNDRYNYLYTSHYRINMISSIIECLSHDVNRNFKSTKDFINHISFYKYRLECLRDDKTVESKFSKLSDIFSNTLVNSSNGINGNKKDSSEEVYHSIINPYISSNKFRIPINNFKMSKDSNEELFSAMSNRNIMQKSVNNKESNSRMKYNIATNKLHSSISNFEMSKDLSEELLSSNSNMQKSVNNKGWNPMMNYNISTNKVRSSISNFEMSKDLSEELLSSNSNTQKSVNNKGWNPMMNYDTSIQKFKNQINSGQRISNYQNVNPSFFILTIFISGLMLVGFVVMGIYLFHKKSNNKNNVIGRKALISGKNITVENKIPKIAKV